MESGPEFHHCYIFHKKRANTIWFVPPGRKSSTRAEDSVPISEVDDRTTRNYEDNIETAVTVEVAYGDAGWSRCDSADRRSCLQCPVAIAQRITGGLAATIASCLPSELKSPRATSNGLEPASYIGGVVRNGEVSCPGNWRISVTR